MLQPNEIYLNGNNSTVQIASAHETSKTFSYNGNEVLFDIKDDVMVNATQLAKIYGKRPNDYLSLPATNQLINAITRKYGISENQLVISKAGSSHNGGGTWMHRLITVSHSEYDMIAVCISDPEDHERDSVAFISREKAHALGEYLLNM